MDKLIKKYKKILDYLLVWFLIIVVSFLFSYYVTIRSESLYLVYTTKKLNSGIIPVVILFLILLFLTITMIILTIKNMYNILFPKGNMLNTLTMKSERTFLINMFKEAKEVFEDERK